MLVVMIVIRTLVTLVFMFVLVLIIPMIVSVFEDALREVKESDFNSLPLGRRNCRTASGPGPFEIGTC